MEFEWDPAKDRANRSKHGLSFEEASELFASGVDYLEIFDAEHSEDEDRFIAIGPIKRGMIVVVHHGASGGNDSDPECANSHEGRDRTKSGLLECQR